MSILIATATLVLAFFFFPISTIGWLTTFAKKRNAAWIALFPKKKEELK